MNMIKRDVLIILIIVAMVVLQGCGPLESVSGDRSMTYNQDFDTMVNTVERAIRGRSLAINFAEKSKDGQRYIVMFHATSYVNNQTQRKHQGEVIIERVSEKQTKVTINNPEYNDMIPSHHREKYDKELKEEIDRLLGQ